MTDNQNVKLLPCPWCSGKIDHWYEGSHDWDFSCSKCNFSKTFYVPHKGDEQPEAIKKYNEWYLLIKWKDKGENEDSELRDLHESQRIEYQKKIAELQKENLDYDYNLTVAREALKKTAELEEKLGIAVEAMKGAVQFGEEHIEFNYGIALCANALTKINHTAQSLDMVSPADQSHNTSGSKEGE